MTHWWKDCSGSANSPGDWAGMDVWLVATSLQAATQKEWDGDESRHSEEVRLNADGVR